jgi:hypothetical protein
MVPRKGERRERVGVLPADMAPLACNAGLESLTNVHLASFCGIEALKGERSGDLRID